MRQPRFSPVTQIHKDRLEVWYAPVFLLEKYSLTVFSLIWFGATILEYYIKIFIVVATLICEIRVNWKVNAGSFNTRFWNLGFVVLSFDIAAILFWKYQFDHDHFLFKYEFIRMIYSYIKAHEILFSSSVTVTQACLQEYEFFHIEKMLLYMSFGFFGIAFLRWIKLYVYKILKDNISRQSNVRTESYARVGVYVSIPSLLWFSYLLIKADSQYCVYIGRKMPIVVFFILTALTIAYDCVNAFRWRLLIGQETKPKEEVKDV